MTNLEITVHVNLGVTPELTALVNAILHKETQPVVAASLEPAPEAAPAPVEEKPARKPRKSKSDTATPETAPASETEAAPETAPAEDEKPKELTEEDVRAAMHRTRTRIEGEDYKENTDGEKYQKYPWVFLVYSFLNNYFLTIVCSRSGPMLIILIGVSN